MTVGGRPVSIGRLQGLLLQMPGFTRLKLDPGQTIASGYNMHYWWLYSIAILCAVLIPVVPALLRLRVRFFKWLDWQWAVKLIEDHFQAWVLLIRILLLMVAAVLLYFGSNQ